MMDTPKYTPKTYPLATLLTVAIVTLFLWVIWDVQATHQELFYVLLGVAAFASYNLYNKLLGLFSKKQ